MIISFACEQTEELYRTGKSRRFQSIAKVALRKLDQLHVAAELKDLLIPPGNHLESLIGSRTGQHSIRINNQWRLCFVWHDGHVSHVEIVDYH